MTYYYMCGYRFIVLATFPNTDLGTAQANQYMEANAGASVLAVEGQTVYLAHKRDEGELITLGMLADELDAIALGQSFSSYMLKYAKGLTESFAVREALNRYLNGAQESTDHTLLQTFAISLRKRDKRRTH